MVSADFLLTLLLVGLMVIPGFIVLRKGRRHASRLLFFLLTVDVAFWEIVNYFTLHSPRDVMLTWIRFDMFFAAPQILLLFLFVHTFPQSHFRLSKKFLIPLVVLLAILMGLCLGPFVFSRLAFKSGETIPDTVPGSAMPLFAAFVIILFIASVVIMVKRLKQSTGIVGQQWKYIFLGFSITFLLDIILLFILPTYALNKDFLPYGNFFPLPFIAATTYAMVRYRFFGIRFIVRKGTIYLLSVIVALFLYSAIILGLSAAIPKPTAASAIVVNLLAVLVIAVSFEPLRRLVRRKVDEWFFPERRKIQQEIKRIQERLPREVNFEKYKGDLFAAFRTVLKFGEGRFLLLDKREGVYREIVPQGKSLPTLRLDDQMVKYVIGKWRIVVRDELPLALEDLSRVEKEELMGIYTKLKNMHASLAMPIGDNARPEGLFFVDAQPRGDAFTADELADIEKVRFAASHALFNAVLYKETIENLGKVRVG